MKFYIWNLVKCVFGTLHMWSHVFMCIFMVSHVALHIVTWYHIHFTWSITLTSHDITKLHVFMITWKRVTFMGFLHKGCQVLPCQDKTWKWIEQCKEAFGKTKETLLKSEALTHFDPSLPIQLAYDASPYGVGAVVPHIMPSGKRSFHIEDIEISRK